MPQHHDESGDPAWELLERAREVDIDPYFAKRVAREAAGTRRSRLYNWLAGQPPMALAGWGTALVLAAFLAIIALGPSGVEQPAPIAETPAAPDAIEHGVAAMDYIDYVDELVATEDPNLLSDADIIELLLDDGSAALLF